MKHHKITHLLGLSAAFLLAILPLLSNAAPTRDTQAEDSEPSKERLVLMPVRLGEEDRGRQTAMEVALLEGLQQRFEVFSGEVVSKKAHEIFLKESRNVAKTECDETRCLQNIAEAFQAELIASANIFRQEDGYFLALTIRNIFDDKVVYSKSVPCKNCDAYQVVVKLKEISGYHEVATTPPAAVREVVVSQPDAPLVGSEIKEAVAPKISDKAQMRLAQQDKSAWENVNSLGTVAGYQWYLNSYPQGIYANQAAARIAKLKVHTADAGEKKKCADCPEVILIPAGNF